MHKTVLNPAVVAKVIARRGRRHVFDTLDPRRTALLVVDLQNAYLDDPSGYSTSKKAQGIVPNVNRIAQALRRAGGTVVWIQNTATKESFDSWSVLNGRMLTPAQRDLRAEALREGSVGHAIWPGLDVLPEDLKVKKTRFSAFIRGASDLEARLRERTIETVVVTGTGTGTCCESTARDAMMLNFATIMVGDANACGSDEEHNASLTAFYRSFGDVMSTDELVGYIQRNAKTASAA